MRLLIWGAGAIGGSMGAYFVRAGHEVSFVDVVQEHVDAINTSGLKIEGPIANFQVQAPAFTPETLTGSWDTILLCVKGHHTESALTALEPFLSDSGYLVSVQNGLNEHLIAQQLGEEKTVGSFVNFGADYLEAGVIHYGGRGAVVLGELNGKATKRLELLHELFLSFDDKAMISPNIWGFLWGKMAYGALLYATALSNDSIADALARPEYAATFIALAKEVLSIASAKQIQPEGFNGFNPQAFMPDTSPEMSQASLEEMVVFNRKSAKTHSGIWRDLAVRKRKTEADAHLGMMIKIAAEEVIKTPLLENVLMQIHAIEEGKKDLSLENLDLLKQEL